MVGVFEVGFGDPSNQSIFDLANVLARCDFGAVCHAENVRIHGHGGVAECGVEYDVGSLAPDPGQRFQGFALFRDLAGVFGDEQLAGFDDVGRLGVVEADALYEGLEFAHP